MTINYEAIVWLKVSEYAARRGVTPRTVMRWLTEGLLPLAGKDAKGRWQIPADVEPLEASALVELPGPAPASTVSYRAALDTAPSFLTIEQAANILGITRHAILHRREQYELDTVGPNGALMMPLATIRRIRGA